MQQFAGKNLKINEANEEFFNFFGIRVQENQNFRPHFFDQRYMPVPQEEMLNGVREIRISDVRFRKQKQIIIFETILENLNRLCTSMLRIARIQFSTLAVE